MSRTLAWLIPVLVLTPASVAGQASHGVGSDSEVGAALSSRAGLTWFANRPVAVLALAGTIRLSPHLEVGGEGVLPLRPVRMSPDDSQDRSELRAGYGGLVVRWRPAGSVPGPRWGGSFLFGAGTARVRSPLVDAEIASSNFLFFEPGAHLLLQQDRWIRFSADAAYRITAGAEDLPRIGARDLRGAVFSLTVQLVRDP